VDTKKGNFLSCAGYRKGCNCCDLPSYLPPYSTVFSHYKQWRAAGVLDRIMTKNFLIVQAPGFIRGINPKSKIENPQAPALIRGVNLKSKI
jgi:hypothetical protein